MQIGMNQHGHRPRAHAHRSAQHAQVAVPLGPVHRHQGPPARVHQHPPGQRAPARQIIELVVMHPAIETLQRALEAHARGPGQRPGEREGTHLATVDQALRHGDQGPGLRLVQALGKLPQQAVSFPEHGDAPPCANSGKNSTHCVTMLPHLSPKVQSSLPPTPRKKVGSGQPAHGLIPRIADRRTAATARNLSPGRLTPAVPLSVHGEGSRAPARRGEVVGSFATVRIGYTRGSQSPCMRSCIDSPSADGKSGRTNASIL